jgi:hypothetical protein
MTKLRDIELRWSQDEKGPEEFRKSGVVGYLFAMELRALKIETPGIAKINAYCEPKPRPYDGDVFDSVTDVQVAIKWSDTRRLPPPELNEYFLSLLVDGTKTVLKRFGIAGKPVETIAAKLREENFELSKPLGRRAANPREPRVAARCHLRSSPSLEHCVVVLELHRGRNAIGEMPICTTFPEPDYALEAFKSLEWSGKDRLKARFGYVGAGGTQVFGRANFDHRGFANVKRIDKSASGAEPVFEVDVSSLVKTDGAS